MKSDVVGNVNSGGTSRRRRVNDTTESPSRSVSQHRTPPIEDMNTVTSNSQSKHHSSSAFGIGKFLLNLRLCLATTIICSPRSVAQKLSAATGRLCTSIMSTAPLGRRSRQLPLLYHRNQTEKQTPQRLRDNLFVIAISLSMLAVFRIMLMWQLARPNRAHTRRPLTNAELDSLPVIIQILEISTADDLGGWIYPWKPFPTIRTLPPLEFEMGEDVVDYGDLVFTLLGGDKPASLFRREIDLNDYEKYEKERKNLLQTMNKDRRGYEHDDEVNDSIKCKRANWASGYYPTCNDFHEIDIGRGYDPDALSDKYEQVYDSYYFNHGFYRDVWTVVSAGDRETMILKQTRWKHDYGHKAFSITQHDAVVMERLTASPRIINMFGHCGASVTVEPIAYEVEEYIVPGDGMIKQEKLKDSQDVNPQNTYTVEEKLEMALTMAESIADLHGYEGGVIVHDDIQLCQWLRTRDDKLILGDFNRAEVMKYNDEKQEYCRYQNGECYGNYRAPEEFANTDLDEGLDLFSYGNNIYALLTGLWVFYDTDDDGVVQNKVINGTRAFVDDRYRTRSLIEGKLVEVMEKCWEHDPQKRIDIFEVIKFLRQVKLESEGGHADI